MARGEDTRYHPARKIERDWSGRARGRNFLFGKESAPKFRGSCVACGNANPDLFEWKSNDGYSNHYSCQGPDCKGPSGMTMSQNIHNR